VRFALTSSNALIMIFIGRKLIFKIGNRMAMANVRWRLPLTLLAAGSILICGANAWTQSKSAKPSPAKANAAAAPAGKRAYSANCAGCHGLDGKGGERAPDIVTRPQARQLSDAAILQILQNGVPNTSMPSFRFLDAKTRASLVAHLRTLQGASALAKLPGNAQRGREIFFSKGECASCHMVHGEGGFLASDLGGFANGRSQESVRDSIVSPNRDLDPRRRVVVATLANGVSLEGIARNEDNFSLQLQTPDGSFHFFDKSQVQSIDRQPRSWMPADYGSKLSRQEIDQLVSYLMSIAQKPSEKDPPEEGKE
jgi:putative heme-binding domain-containing protein